MWNTAAMSSARTLGSSNLAPGLLLAMPQLADPNFARSVVLMIEHGDDGSFGLVINQPGPIKATELLSGMSLAWGGDPAEPVWTGGPVRPTVGWVLHAPDAEVPPDARLGEAPTILVAPGIALTSSSDRLRTLAATPPARFRLLLGFAGWAPGQLAGEMARGAWLHAEADPAVVFDTPPETMWDRAVASLGIRSPEALAPSRGVN
jgi:putative transcriptional regulator